MGGPATPGPPSRRSAAVILSRTRISAAALAVTLVCAACGSSSTSTGGGGTPTPTASPYNPIYGVDLGIHVLSGTGGEDPVSDADIVKLLTVLQGRTQWIRVYNVLGAAKDVPRLAHQMGFKVAAQSPLDARHDVSETQLKSFYTMVNQGFVDLAVIGNEQVHIKSMTSPQLIGYINEAKAAIGGKVPVATVEPDKELLAHPEIMQACDVVLANIPPISYGIPPDQALDYIQKTYAQLSSMSGGHEVRIGETEWPSGGDRPLVAGKPFVGPQIAATYFTQVETWARQNNVGVFYFEAFDEPWLGQFDSVGSHWGIFTSQLTLKPGFEGVFQK
jgi:exo-beta-1,3-glucanase (GH17 family)